MLQVKNMYGSFVIILDIRRFFKKTQIFLISQNFPNSSKKNVGKKLFYFEPPFLNKQTEI